MTPFSDLVAFMSSPRAGLWPAVHTHVRASVRDRLRLLPLHFHLC